MRTLIHSGLVIDPANEVEAKLNLILEDGKVAEVCTQMPDFEGFDRIIDAEGKIVCPGFIDIHMHEDAVDENGRIYDAEDAIQKTMLRMGVTTAIAGQCGENKYHPADYLDIVDRDGTAVNLGILVGHGFFRAMAGCRDKYAPATIQQRNTMKEEIAKALDRGCLGVSYGIRYVPGIDMEELAATAEGCYKDGKIIAAHIRDDAEAVFDAAKEMLETGRKLNIPVQISHIGSMAGFGQMEEFLRMIDEYHLNGLDVNCDCYPYYAFSTSIGATTYDGKWYERYGADYDVVEICEGKYKGMRCNKEIFEEVRRDMPDCITVCHVMKPDDVDMAFRHPGVMVASDGLLNKGQGHPRAAGTFPRLFAKFVRPGKLDLYKAVGMITSMPADKMKLKNKGRLNVGADADVVIFDLDKISDEATFDSPVTAPKGIEYVLIGGELALENGEIVNGKLGRSVRR